jgi:YrbI family 3-deoxy-D-manno-octulosonate 8-phosphate phosphatase
MPTKTCATVILARGGSKGVPGKNLRPVGGVSLIGRAVRAGMQAASQAAVYVSTDDDEIATEARLFGARIIERPVDISGDTASSEAGWLHALPLIRRDLPDLENLVFLQCTSPFITGGDIDACLQAMLDANADCALSVVEDHSFLWGLDTNGRGIGQNHDHTQQRKRRQDLPPQYRENGAIYCVNADAFEATGQRFCGTVALCPVDQPPLEIDSLADLELASVMAHTRDHSGVTPDALKRVRALVMDFDGVHTDNLVITDQNGVEAVRTSRGDGMGLAELARRTGILRLIVSKERNPVVLARAAKLGIDVQSAIDDKVAALDTWLGAQGLDWSEMLYVGNDINDAAPMAKAGLAACPSDAHGDVLGLAQWILPHPGGHGALRHLCDVLVDAHDPK